MSLHGHGVVNVWLSSSDLERSKRFYRDTLGLPLLNEEPGEALHFDAGGSVLSLHIQVPGESLSKSSWLVFCIPHDLDTVYEDLGKSGVEWDAPLQDLPFGRGAMFLDPDGNELWLWETPKQGDARRSSYSQVAPLVETLTARLRGGAPPATKPAPARPASPKPRPTTAKKAPTKGPAKKGRKH